MSANLEWEPPAGGTWEYESVHTNGPMWQTFQDVFPDAMGRGSAEMFRRYGVPLERIDARFINNCCFVQVVPVGAPRPKLGKPNPEPPAAVLRVVSRVHPEMRRRRRAARAALTTKRWRGDADAWYERIGPKRIEANRALVGEDVEHLEGPALADHLERAASNFADGAQEHFHLTMAHNVAVGRLVARCDQWQLDVNDVLTLLAGSSPASSETVADIRRIADACTAAGVRPAGVEEIRAASPAAADALDQYLDDHGWRILTGYGPDDLALIEVPNVIVASVIATMDGTGSSAPSPADVDGAPSREASVRERVPANDRGLFDELLAEARSAYGVRDANVGPTFQWPVGILRRALLASGRNLVDAGVLDTVDEIGLLHLTEITSILRSDGKVDAETLERRRATWAAVLDDPPPAELGAAPVPPPDPSLFPPEIAEVTRAAMATLDLPDNSPPENRPGTTAGRWQGDPAGRGCVTGRACVSPDAADALARVEPGDILVTPFTTPAYNAVLPVLAGLVVEHAGPFSHAAIVAREFGLPAVLGVPEATATIADGATIVVDAGNGTVRLS